MPLAPLLFASLALAQTLPAEEPVAEPAPVEPTPEDSFPAPDPAGDTAAAWAELSLDELQQLCDLGGDQLDECVAGLSARLDLLGPLLAALGDGSQADRELLQSLLLLLSNDAGVLGAESLGALGDERALGPLVHTARTRELEVASAACRALARYPEATEALTMLVLDYQPSNEVRQAAADALGLQGSEPAADALLGLLDRDLPRAVRETVMDTVRRYYPGRVDQLRGEVAQRGTGWLMVGGAGALGYGLASVGHYGQADLEGLGAATGALAGGSLGFVAGKRWPVEAGDAAFLSSTSLVGTASGTLLGCSVGHDTACWTGGLLGEAAGITAGAMLMDEYQGSQVDGVEALVLSGTTGLSAGTAFGYMARELGWADEDVAPAATGLGLAGGLAVGHFVAPRVHLTGSDVGQMTLGGIYGGFAGALILGDDSEGLTMWTGLGLGTMAGYGLAEPLEMGGDAVFTGYAGLTYGIMVGLGGGLLLGEVIEIEQDTGESLLKGAALLGGTAGTGLGSYLAWKNPAGIKANDVIFTGLGTGWAQWQTTGWWFYADKPQGSAGVNALVPAAVGSAAAIASPRIDIGVGDTLSATSLGLWGAYVGGVGSLLADADGDQTLLATLVASDVGLGTGILLMSPVVDASPVVVGLADAGGVVGATMGAVVVALGTGEQDPILIASLVGAGAGALGGGLLGARLEERDRMGRAQLLLPRPNLRLPGQWALSPAAVSDGETTSMGAALQVTGW